MELPDNSWKLAAER